MVGKSRFNLLDENANQWQNICAYVTANGYMKEKVLCVGCSLVFNHRIYVNVVCVAPLKAIKICFFFLSLYKTQTTEQKELK